MLAFRNLGEKTMRIDLNADLGEGGPHDRELLGIVSSANISCGVHAGNADTLAAAIRHSLAQGVAIGAHPSFPDREHFGRRAMALSFDSLRDHLLYQLHALAGLVQAEGGALQHVKPHGALYNQAAVDAQLAEDLVRIVREFNPGLRMVGLASGKLIAAARAEGMTVWQEAFADRRYAPDGTLLSRTDPRALIHEEEEALEQCLQILTTRSVTAIDGSRVALCADTLCLHGDSAEALAFARRLREGLAAAGIETGHSQTLADIL